ncbi:MAG: alpha-L-fucosidase [Janthinobacterium lividum]
MAMLHETSPAVAGLCRDWARGLVFLVSVCTAGTWAPAQTTAPAATRPTTPESWNTQWVQASAGATQARAAQFVDLNRTLAAGPFRNDWQSLQQHQSPDWFHDAKFGIFLHWGVFSVPAFGSEWYSRNMYQQGTREFAHHVATYGPQSSFGYKDFIPQFRMEHFDPNAWADLFLRSGARYVIPVAEHHDGFALYKTDLSPWNAVAMGPHRDLVGDLEAAVRAHGLHFGVSYHRAEHDWFFDGGRAFNSDVNDPRFAGFYGPAEERQLESKDDAVLNRDYTFVSEEFRQDWLARTVEVVERYHPDLVYFDWWVGFPDFRATQERFATFYYNFAAQHAQSVVLFSKYDNMAEGAGTLDVERGALSGIQPLPWQTDTSLSNASWGFVEGDTYKTPEVLLDQLVDIVSKNGNLLLNIGPRADGTIPEAAQATLVAMGRWLQVNGEAIYGSRPWTLFGEGPTQIQSGTFQDTHAPAYTPADFRFTTRAGSLYAIEMRWPKDNQAIIHSLKGGTHVVRAVTLVGSRSKLHWQQSEDGLHIQLPAQQTGEYGAVFRIELE